MYVIRPTQTMTRFSDDTISLYYIYATSSSVSRIDFKIWSLAS
jgi:hypothetical protein